MVAKKRTKRKAQLVATTTREHLMRCSINQTIGTLALPLKLPWPL